MLVTALAGSEGPTAWPAPLLASLDPSLFRLVPRLSGRHVSAARAAQVRMDKRQPASVVQAGICSRFATGEPDRFEPCWIVVQRAYGRNARGKPAQLLSFVSARTGRYMGGLSDEDLCCCPANPVPAD